MSPFSASLEVLISFVQKREGRKHGIKMDTHVLKSDWLLLQVPPLISPLFGVHRQDKILNGVLYASRVDGV